MDWEEGNPSNNEARLGGGMSRFVSLGGTVCPRLVVDLYIGNFIFIVQRKKRMSAMHQKHTSPYDMYILNSVY